MNSRSLAVRSRMLEIGLPSVRALADKSGLSQSVVSQWLAYKNVSPETFSRIAEGLNLTTEQLQRLVEGRANKAAG